MFSFARVSNKLSMAAMTWVGMPVAAIAAIRIYYVREMIAALIMFSVFFVAVAAIVALFFLLDFVSRHLAAGIEAGVAHMANWIVAILKAMLESTPATRGAAAPLRIFPRHAVEHPTFSEAYDANVIHRMNEVRR